jgi:soluble lytic murein transglycosylase-like protein
MARARRNRRVRRRRRTGRLDPRVRRALGWAAAAALGCVLAINGAVRAAGGDPSWLSPLYLPQKARALSSLYWHSLWHGSACEERVPKQLVIDAARRHRVPEALALAVARSESSLRAHVISSTGAMGVMQLMPATAAWLGVDDAFDPEANCDGGARYLAWLSRRYGGERARLIAAYNAGPGNVPQRGGYGTAPETRAYVARVIAGSGP